MLREKHKGIGSHELGLCQLERGGCHDVLDAYNCGNSEDVVQQVHMVECAYLRGHQDTEGKGQDLFGICEKLALFAGMHRELGDHVVCPDFLDFLSREVEEDANNKKQARKVREEQHLAGRSEKGRYVALAWCSWCSTLAQPTPQERGGADCSWTTTQQERGGGASSWTGACAA